jgi:Zn-dependent peptidase ImmA (M78 family)
MPYNSRKKKRLYMADAIINIEMLVWARERSGILLPEFAKKCGVSEQRLFEWESGAKSLTFLQAKRYADKSYIPFGYLFLENPPEDVLPIPDLRTLDGSGVSKPSSELLDLIKLMFQRREWFKEYLKDHLSEVNRIVGRCNLDDGVQHIVNDMRVLLAVPEHPVRGSWEDYYRDLVARIEKLGILVMRQSDLGHYTRPLKVEEFRGFAITDNYAPILFVNHADAPGARLFTLIHELCHIWIGQSGVSDGSSNTERKEEILCNAVAAEFLVPAKEFKVHWNVECESWKDNLPTLEGVFHVSTCALSRRALTLGYISQLEYQSYILEQQDLYRKRDKKGTGPTYYKTKKAQISVNFSRAVVSQALSGQLMLREASYLLGGIKPGKISIFAKELGI